MASVVNRPNGHKWIQFKGPCGKRQTIRLGKASKREAKDIRDRIEALVSAKVLGHPPDWDTSRWLAELPRQLYNRMANAGLAQDRPVRTVAELVTAFQGAADVKPSTKVNVQVLLGNMSSFFGSSKNLSDITRADAQEFRSWLKGCGNKHGGPLARSTVSRRCRRAKQVFKYATDKRWLAENPFDEMKGWNEVNRARDFDVTREIIGEILDAAPDAEFRTIVALARFGGVRCPSEVLSMEWSQVNWNNETILVFAPKTEEYEDQGQRRIPMFPEIKTHLQELWEQAGQNEPLLFPKHQVSNAALTGKLERICRSLGKALWPKPWVNMRGTCESELFAKHPIHVASQWLGHSPTIALKHYARIVKDQEAKNATQPLNQSTDDSPGTVSDVIQ